MPSEEIVFKPIGIVTRGLDPGIDSDKYSFTSTIRIYDEYVDALTGLEEYSHAIILFHLDRAGEWAPIVSFKGRKIGVLATRSPFRPNPIGVSVVRIEELRPPYLHVTGLDAWSGSPILDIKPYDLYDIVCNPRVPDYDIESFRRKRMLGAIPPWVGPCTDH